MIGLRSVPIISLISFLVGGIVAQQGIFQLNTFGAPLLVVDLVGILTLRELALLLTSIMIAGRSGSSITAELGSMKMREEIDALHVIGLDPMEVLILPRVIALLLSMPLLTFISSMSALFARARSRSLWRDQPRSVPVQAAERRRYQHVPGRDDQGALHGVGRSG